MNYVNIIPLAGGMTFANMNVTGTKPVGILSWDAFYENDKHLLRHIDASDIYWSLDHYNQSIAASKHINSHGSIDFVSMVPPCAGLSMLNSSNSSIGLSRGSNAAQNNWMHQSINEAITRFNPKVIWGENAPGLYGTSGVGVVDQFKEVAAKHGYSLSLYKTDSTLHGIPQQRTRTYFFFWKSSTAPILNWYKTPHVTLSEYLSNVPEDSLYYNKYAKNHTLDSDPFYNWIIEYYGENFRDLKKMGFKSILQYIFKDESEYLDRYESIYNFMITQYGENSPPVKKLQHIKHKIDQGKGYWDNSPVITGDVVNAVISKNMYNSLHPTEPRFINISEYMYLMGLPLDYLLDKPTTDSKVITQNVPVKTTEDMTRDVCRFIHGELPLSSHEFIKQNNLSQSIEEASKLIEPNLSTLW